jgi:hypothetical protein
MVIVWKPAVPVYEGQDEDGTRGLVTMPDPAFIIVGNTPLSKALEFWAQVKALSGSATL